MFTLADKVISNKAIGIILVSIYFCVSLISLFHLSHRMEMSGNSSDCPFMSHEETFCPMSFFDHLEAWKSAYLAVVPTVTSLLLVLAAVILFSFVPNLIFKQKYRAPNLLKRRIESKYLFSRRPWQELFSSGILNPKLF